MNEEARAYHTLALLTESNYSALLKLKSTYGSWREALGSFKTNSRLPTKRDVLEKIGGRLILREDGEFPPSLREIPHAPFGIYIRGTLPDFTSPWIAIVGTRKATAEGKRIAREFACSLAQEKCTVVSGLAFGIDAAAHEGVLEAIHSAGSGTSGSTVAVLGRGIDRIYPAIHERLARRILESGGAIVSEYPPGTPSVPYRFLERNRIVSGISRGVVVIEAPERSGALATARFANEQNRDVFVVPGFARHPHYRGSHALIRQGATLVTEPQEVLSDLGIEMSAPTKEIGSRTGKLALTEKDAIILRVMKDAGKPLSSDEIVAQSGLDAATVHRSIGTLSIYGVTKESGGRFSL